MEEDGGLAKYSTNKAGAKYGTGYCDTQCPHDIKFIAGEVSGNCTSPPFLLYQILRLTPFRPTPKAGTLATAITMPVPANMELAATRWM
jgi:hypothetical protein